MWSWAAAPGSVVSGVLVAAILAVARMLWNRGRVPTALARRVRRRSYLGAVRAESRRPSVRKLDVLAPRLMPVRSSKTITDIQAAWEQINGRGEVRVLTLDSDECLQAGAELVKRGIEVRVPLRGLDSESLSFHLFETADPAKTQAIINHHQGDVDKPVRLKGAAPTQPFGSHFHREWNKARPLESVIADRILPRMGALQGRETVLRSLEQARTKLNLDEHTTEAIRPHLAFRDTGALVFILGQPGAGKSYIRNGLEDQLRSMRIECQSLTDYPYAYLDLVRTVLRLSPRPKSGYSAHDGGAFVARDEATLTSALRALERAVRDSMQTHEVTLVEFARADLVAALQEFEAARCRSQVIHVTAPAELRLARLSRRAVPPETSVTDQVITLSLSDNHLLPTAAERGLYAVDGIDGLKATPQWRDRIFEIDNGFDGRSHVETKLGEFIQRVLDPYLPQGIEATPRREHIASLWPAEGEFWRVPADYHGTATTPRSSVAR
jgi:dephospho-CoA kinase